MKTAERFIKKQVTVEAIQFNGNSNRAGIELFVGKELKTELESETAYIAGHGAPIFSLLIETKEGVMKAFKNDWIIKEPFPTGDRDFYPCKSDIFEKTYSPLASHPSPMSAADMTAREYFDGEGSPLTLSKICNDEEKEFLLQHIELYASGKVHQSKQPPMSAEQVELLESSKIALHTLDCIEFTREQGTASKRLETAISNFATTPSVKADGWVSVEDELPKVGQKVDLWLVPDDEEKSYRMTWTWEKESTARITINGCKVTHWQPFTPPKQHLQTITSK